MYKLRCFFKNIQKLYNVTGLYVLFVILALIFVLLGVTVFVELTRSLKTDALLAFDKQVTKSVLSYRSPALTQYFVVITKMGNAYSYLVIVGLYTIISCFVLKKFNYLIQITSVLCLSALSNSVIKHLVNRPRPEIEHLVTVKSLSYPSGHAMVAIAFYGFFAYLFYKQNLPGFVKLLIGLVLLFLVLSIGVSRVYLGVHFPSDVIGGFIAGAIWVVFCIIVFNLIKTIKQRFKIV